MLSSDQTRGLYHFQETNWKLVELEPNFLKAHANGRNKCQQLPTSLGLVGRQCCVRLNGPKSLTGFKLYVTSANKCQHYYGSMQTDATSHNIVGPNNIGCCWPTMLGPFAWALRWLPPVLHFPEPLNFTKGFLAHHDGLVPVLARWCYSSF